MRKKSFAFIVLIIVLGALLGSALGEIIAYILPSGVVKDFFLKAITANLGPGTLNLVLITLTLGFSLKLNVAGIIGVIIAAYILRWVD